MRRRWGWLRWGPTASRCVCIHVSLSVCVWTDRQMDRWTDGEMDRWTDRWTDTQMNRHRWTDRWTDGQMGRLMDRRPPDRGACVSMLTYLPAYAYLCPPACLPHGLQVRMYPYLLSFLPIHLSMSGRAGVLRPPGVYRRTDGRTHRQAGRRGKGERCRWGNGWMDG